MPSKSDPWYAMNWTDTPISAGDRVDQIDVEAAVAGTPLNGGSGNAAPTRASSRNHRSCSSDVRAWSIWSYA